MSDLYLRYSSVILCLGWGCVIIFHLHYFLVEGLSLGSNVLKEYHVWEWMSVSAFVFHNSRPEAFREATVLYCLVPSFHTWPVQQKFRRSFMGQGIMRYGLYTMYDHDGATHTTSMLLQ